MLRMTLLATVAVAGLSAAAWAGEGNGDPFPGPDAATTSTIQNPKYTMGSDAPFNYYGAAKPVPLTNYKQAEGTMDNPYPFSMPGQVIRTQPMPPTSLANHANGNTHG